jgi:hypothetical protein
MTITERVVIDLGDLQTITFVCTTCDASVTLRVADFKNLQPHCPGCGVQWIVATGAADKAVRQLIQGLHDVAALAENRGLFRVRFEVPPPARSVKPVT